MRTSFSKAVEVLIVTQSPPNKNKWYMSLACGHLQVVTSATRPKKKRMICRTCDSIKITKT